MLSPLRRSISIVVTAHTEGILLSSTLKSIENSIVKLLNVEDCSINTLVILDNSDLETSSIAYEYMASSISQTQIYKVQFSDLAKSRNFAVESTDSDWITFIDGDDLMGADWLKSLTSTEIEFDKKSIYHPSYLVFFGKSRRIHYQNLFDKISFEELLKIIILYNPWGSPLFAFRNLLLENKFQETDHLYNLGFEDWTFNRMTLIKHIRHLTIPNTFYFVRDREDSLSKHKNLNHYFPSWP
jgi:cellulose synthase/poly-beta-1,6-N-acetylglucosamine synthase-like glycosyltransferase